MGRVGATGRYNFNGPTFRLNELIGGGDILDEANNE